MSEKEERNVDSEAETVEFEDYDRNSVEESHFETTGEVVASDFVETKAPPIRRVNEIRDYGDVFEDSSSATSSKATSGPYSKFLSRLADESNDQEELKHHKTSLLQTLGKRKIYIAGKGVVKKGENGESIYSEPTGAAISPFRCCFIVSLVLMAALAFGGGVTAVAVRLTEDPSSVISPGNNTEEPTVSPTVGNTVQPTFVTVIPTAAPTDFPVTGSVPTIAPTSSPVEFALRCQDAPIGEEGWKFCADETTLVDCVANPNNQISVPEGTNGFTDCTSKPERRVFCRCPSGKPFNNQFGCVKVNNVNRNCE